MGVRMLNPPSQIRWSSLSRVGAFFPLLGSRSLSLLPSGPLVVLSLCHSTELLFHPSPHQASFTLKKGAWLAALSSICCHWGGVPLWQGRGKGYGVGSGVGGKGDGVNGGGSSLGAVCEGLGAGV